MDKLTIKTYYKKDLLITFANGEQVFLLWGDYTIFKVVEVDDGEEWIQIEYTSPHNNETQSIMIAETGAVDQDERHGRGDSDSVTIEILN